MKCPHCQVAIHENFENKTSLYSGRKPHSQYQILKWIVELMTCPACHDDIIHLAEVLVPSSNPSYISSVVSQKMIYPEGASRSLPSTHVPEQFKKDYIEASKVIHLSEKASAALSRRCLQNIIHNHLGIKAKDLFTEIQSIRDQGKLPSDIADQLDQLREIGNFAAHPKKDSLTGEIIEVDAGEAEWALDILDEIFDYCFDRPARILSRKEVWESKKSKNP
jgi:hypothetical protein